MNDDTGLSRRTLLRAGIVAGAGSAVVTAGGSRSYAATASGPLSYVDFALRVGTDFTFRDQAGRACRLRLVDAKLTPVVATVVGAGEAYSLLFEGDRGERVESEVYALRHPSLGEVDLFLHPVGADRGYEAVVNHWLPVSK